MVSTTALFDLEKKEQSNYKYIGGYMIEVNLNKWNRRQGMFVQRIHFSHTGPEVGDQNVTFRDR